MEQVKEHQETEPQLTRMRQVKSLLETPGWRILEEHLETLLTQKEQVRSSLLRQPNNDSLVRAAVQQAFIDGVRSVLVEAKALAKAKPQQQTPSY